ncbi:MAG: LytR C-terminal domain-containing protein [Elusimicrobia bacterium]|nr:LytR C-terminal domain-containing protein [Elusimicrobiota bacterium]
MSDARVVGSGWRRGELALACLSLALAAGLAVLESRSELARALRAGAPLLGTLALEDRKASSPAASFVAVYHPVPRSLIVVELPAGTAGALLEAAPGGLASAPIRLTAAAEGPPASAGAARRWIAGWPRGLAFWLEAARWARASGRRVLGAYDLVLLALEGYRLPLSELRLSTLPAPALRARLLEALAAPAEPAAEPAALRVEVLNASGESGIALQATKVLRWLRVDVMDFGNAPTAVDETRFIDRLGRPQDARRVAALLGCPDAEFWTRLEPDAAAPVAAVLGRDFRRCGALAPAGR